jgi:UDP-glucose 4-epimerase
MRVAITGATGLIGGHVTERLAQVHEVTRLGRSSGSDLTVDLAEPESIAALNLKGYDALIHCAGVVDGDFREDPSAAWRKSTLGMRLLVERALDAGVTAIGYISTSHVYGPPVGRIDERTCPAPVTDYAIAHLASERILASAAEDRPFRGLILRPNAVFGMPSLATFDRWNLIPYSFPRAAVYDQEIVLLSTGEQRRNFVAAADLAAWIEAFLDGGPSGCAIVNPIGLDDLSVYDLAGKCADIYSQLTGRQCTISRPAPTGDQPGDDFVYTSRHQTTPARHRLEDYLRSFMCRLMEEWQYGRRYGD